MMNGARVTRLPPELSGRIDLGVDILPLTSTLSIMNTPHQSYWNGAGKYQSISDALEKLIPKEGECPDAQGANKALDRFRRASNCYYDLFNNGLCNRADEFRKLFRVGKLPRKWNGHRIELDFETIEKEGKVEAVVDRLTIEAAIEQGLKLTVG